VGDWDAGSYREVSQLQRQLATRALDRVELGGDHDVLDVGCGDGRITALIARRVPAGTVLGIDSSAAMIEAARGAEATRALPNLRFQRCDVRALPYRDRFDWVVSFNVLHWVPDQAVALDRICAALHPSGTALLQFVCAGERPSLEDIAAYVCGLPRWRGFFAGFRQPFHHVDPGGYPHLAAASSLRVLETCVEDVTWDFGSRAAFARWCQVGFVSWTSRLPDGLATVFLDEVLDAYERVVGPSGTFLFLQMQARLAPI